MRRSGSSIRQLVLDCRIPPPPPRAIPTCFNDVTTGNNRWSQSPTLFDARNGYDLCTGLGTLKGTALINALVTFNSNVGSHLAAAAAVWLDHGQSVFGGNPNGAWSCSSRTTRRSVAVSLPTVGFFPSPPPTLRGTAADLELQMTTTNSTVFVGQPGELCGDCDELRVVHCHEHFDRG